MKLWLLLPIYKENAAQNHWRPWFDTAAGFVIAARTEDSARALAADQCGDEGYRAGLTNPWLDITTSTCVELVPGEKELVILRDFNAA